MRILSIAVMVGIISLIGYLGISFFGSSRKPAGAKRTASIYDLSYTSIDGKVVKLDSYRGKKLMIVNVASECGFTPQYDGLEKLYEEHRDRLVIVGFPANDFGGKEILALLN